MRRHVNPISFIHYVTYSALLHYSSPNISLIYLKSDVGILYILSIDIQEVFKSSIFIPNKKTVIYITYL